MILLSRHMAVPHLLVSHDMDGAATYLTLKGDLRLADGTA
jgi:hypothetical protein